MASLAWSATLLTISKAAKNKIIHGNRVNRCDRWYIKPVTKCQVQGVRISLLDSFAIPFLHDSLFWRNKSSISSGLLGEYSKDYYSTRNIKVSSLYLLSFTWLITYFECLPHLVSLLVNTSGILKQQNNA